MEWKPFADKHFSGFQCEIGRFDSSEDAVISAQVYTCANMSQQTQTGVEWRWHVWPCMLSGYVWPHEAVSADEGKAAAEKEMVALVRYLAEQIGLNLEPA